MLCGAVAALKRCGYGFGAEDDDDEGALRLSRRFATFETTLLRAGVGSEAGAGEGAGELVLFELLLLLPFPKPSRHFDGFFVIVGTGGGAGTGAGAEMGLPDSGDDTPTALFETDPPR